MSKKILPIVLLLLVLAGCSTITTESTGSFLSSIIGFFTSRIVNYLFLFIGFMTFLFIAGSVKDNTAISLLCLMGAFTVVASAAYYWRMGLILTDLPEKEIFVEALDRGMAFATVSTAVLLFLSNAIYLVIFIVGRTFANLIDFFYKLIGWAIRRDATNASALTRGCMGNLLVIFWLLAIPFGYYLLMIATLDLQNFLFGKFDVSLGWNHPSSFKFIALLNQLQLQSQAIRNDPLLGLFIVPLGIFIGVMIKIGGAIDAIKKIRGFFVKKQASDI